MNQKDISTFSSRLNREQSNNELQKKSSAPNRKICNAKERYKGETVKTDPYFKMKRYRAGKKTGEKKTFNF